MYFLFQIADGMTIKVGTMNLLIKTHGVAPCEGGITGYSLLSLFFKCIANNNFLPSGFIWKTNHLTCLP
jgi:hypothetical protein